MNLLPRNIVPMAKIEVYNYPIVGSSQGSMGSYRSSARNSIGGSPGALEVLKAGEIILVAPEAHRGPELRQGKEGIAYLATRSNAPIVPVAIDGTIGYPTLPILPRWWEPGARVKFGFPFRFKIGSAPGGDATPHDR
jgi:1-acyl-sn-glycerol-3-phosphate acyltransferase